MALLVNETFANPTKEIYLTAASGKGATGPTGATGPAGLSSVSAFYGSPTLNTLITTTGIPATQIGSTINITTSTTGYIWACATGNFTSNDNTADHPISMYVVVDGTTSTPSTNIIPKTSGSIPLQTSNLSINQRTNTIVPAGTYSIQVYAYTNASGVSGSHIRCDHIDVFALGNLS